MDAISASVTLKALDGLTARSVATAQNIANAGTPGYRPIRVTFETALAEAAGRGAAAIAEVQPAIEADTAFGGQDLRVDMELATASSTAMRYAALIELLGRQMQIDALAVSGNR